MFKRELIVSSSWRMWLMSAFLLLAFGACTNDDSNESTPKGITVNQESIIVDAAGGQKVVTVTSGHTDFDVATEADWISYIIANKGFQLTFQPNGSKSVREAVVVVSALDGSTVSISVRQIGLDPALVLDKEAIPAAQKGDTASVSVTSNIEWKIVCQENWIYADVNDAGDAVSIVVLENEQFESRSAAIGVVPVSDDFSDLKKEIVVTQAARPYMIEVSGEGLDAGKLQVLSVVEQPVKLNVVANSDWSISSTAEWLNATPAEGEATDYLGQDVALSFGENGETGDRQTEIVFMCGDKTVKVKVVQKGAALFFDLLDKKMSKLTNAEQTEWTGSSECNGSVSASVSDASWLSASVDGLTYKITAAANTSGARREGTVTLTASLAGNEDIAKTYTVVQLPEAVDLSKDGTANCYMVNRAGTYKLNATVQGNGASTYRIKPEAINPSDGVLVWSTSDKEDLIGDVMVKDGSLYFTTNGQPGNALVAALEGDDLTGRYIAWSWHIWMTPDDMNAAENQREVTDRTYAAPATWMDRNLGALSNGSLGTKEDVHKSFGMIYQFGRKDPLPGASVDRIQADWTVNLYGDSPTSNATVAESGWGANQNVSVEGTAETVYYHADAYVDENGNTVIPTSSEHYKVIANTEVEDIDMTKVKGGIELATLNPATFIGCGGASPYIWCIAGATPVFDDPEGGWGHLWGNCATSKDFSSRGEKTIYDPCPVGWKVPSSSEFAFITSHGDDLGRNYLGNAPWKANCLEVYDAYRSGNVWKAQLSGNTSNYNTRVKLNKNVWGFHFFIDGHPVGVALPAPAEGEEDTRKVYEGYESIPDGEMMFLPAAGCITHGGLMARVGASCHYWTNQTAAASSNTKQPYPEAGYPLAGGIEASMIFEFYRSCQRDYNQVGVGASVRCVKVE